MNESILRKSRMIGGGITLLLAASGAEALTIDTFDDGWALLRKSNPGPVYVQAQGAIGGGRMMKLMGYPEDTDPVSEGTWLEVKNGVLGHSQDAFAKAGRSMIMWDGMGQGLGGIDLTEGGTANAFLLEVISIDIGTVSVSWEVQSDKFGTATLMLPDRQETVEQVVYEDFVGYSDEIFTDVDSITMTVEAGWASDLKLDLFGTTSVAPPMPEPTTLAMSLILLSLCGPRAARNTIAQTRRD